MKEFIDDTKLPGLSRPFYTFQGPKRRRAIHRRGIAYSNAWTRMSWFISFLAEPLLRWLEKVPSTPNLRSKIEQAKAPDQNTSSCPVISRPSSCLDLMNGVKQRPLAKPLVRNDARGLQTRPKSVSLHFAAARRVYQLHALSTDSISVFVGTVSHHHD